MFVIFSASLIALGLRGQENPSRVGFAVGYASPQELHASTGIAGGLNIYFNQGTPREGRIRLEGVSFGAKKENSTITTLESQGTALTASYDWMPGNRNIQAILGIGGMQWYQKLEQYYIVSGSGPSFRAYGGSKSGFSMVPTLGMQVRLNKYFSIEGRYAHAVNISNKKKYFFIDNESSQIREMSYFLVGIELRFPSLR
jgi:hypothetical protein